MHGFKWPINSTRIVEKRQHLGVQRVGAVHCLLFDLAVTTVLEVKHVQMDRLAAEVRVPCARSLCSSMTRDRPQSTGHTSGGDTSKVVVLVLLFSASASPPARHRRIAGPFGLEMSCCCVAKRTDIAIDNVVQTAQPHHEFFARGGGFA